MPTTFWTYLAGSLALAGVPPLAGFWSKDEILTGAWAAASHGEGVAMFVFLAGMVTAFLTAVYTARMLALTFFGKPRYDTAHVKPHEPSGAMRGPLVILAILAVAGGFVGLPGAANLFGKWVHFAGAEHADFNLPLALGSIALAVGGLAVGWWIFRLGRVKVDLLRTPFAWVYRLLQNKYYMDDLYMRLIVRPIRDPLARFMYWTNQKVLDAVVNLAGVTTLAAGRGAYFGIDQPVIDGAVNGLAFGTGAAGSGLKFWQAGNVQIYASLLFFGIVVFVGAFLVLRG
jgi:NADH-quinone oxidoreductase subunit L